jgi:membrane associated rhomboid family serine protease
MLPLKDINPTRRVPVITYGLIAVNVLVFLWEQTLSIEALQQQFMNLSVVPANITANPFALETILDLVRSMFFHGGWAHLLGNMLYLWLFGDNLEDRMGKVLYIIFYFFGGFAASVAQIVIDPNSQIPLIGASGAIAGVLGGYLVMFPGVKVRGIIPLGWMARWAEWPAWADRCAGWGCIFRSHWRFRRRPYFDMDIHAARPTAAARTTTRNHL